MGKTVGLILALQDKCSPQLENVRKKMNISEKDAKRFDQTVKNLSKDFKKWGDNLKKSATAVGVGFSAVVATAGVLVNKSMEAGDRIDKMSQKIGMSRKAFQEWDFIMSQNGGNVESLQMGYKALANQMNGVQKGSKDSIGYFQKLGVAVKDSRGQLRSQEDVFNDTIRALQKMKNPTEKAIIASKLFGKSALEMKPLLNQSANAVDNLRQKANDLGMVMSDDAVDASVKLKDTIDTIQRTFSAFGNQIGAEIMPIVQDLADELINHLPQIKSVLTPIFTSISNTLKFTTEHFKGLIITAGICYGSFMTFKAIQGIGAFFLAYGKILKGLRSEKAILTAINYMLAKSEAVVNFQAGLTIIKAGICKVATIAWGQAVNVVTIAQKALNFALINNPIGRVIMIVTGLIGIFVALYKNCRVVREAVDNLFNSLKKFFGQKFGKKTIEIESKESTKKEKTSDTTSTKKNAVGTAYFSGGATRINEFGGEIVDLPQGSRIIPHDISQQMAKNSGGGITVYVNIMGNMVGNNEFLNQLTDVFTRKLQVAMAVR